VGFVGRGTIDVSESACLLRGKFRWPLSRRLLLGGTVFVAALPFGDPTATLGAAAAGLLAALPASRRELAIATERLRGAIHQGPMACISFVDPSGRSKILNYWLPSEADAEDLARLVQRAAQAT
jgi:hypothetical protein